MKKMHYILALAFTLVLAGQVKTRAALTDTSAVRMEVTNNLDKLHHAMQTMDRMTVQSLLSNDVLFLGTDPSEIFDKQQALNMMNDNTATYSDSQAELKYKIDTRKVLVSDDGNSAITVEQFMVPQFSKVMPVRLITHLVRTSDGWKFNFVSWNFIPPNEDLKTIDEALEGK